MLIHGLTLSWAFIYMYLICARAFIGHDLTLSLMALASHSLTQLRYPPHPGGDPTRSQYRVVETREYNFIYIMYIDTSEGGAEALRSLLTFLGICYFSIPAAPRTPYAKFNLEYFLSCPWPLMASLNEI